MTNAYKVLDKKPEIKRALGKPIRRRKDAVKIYFKKLLGKV
jgi:hypothetical protein